MPCSKVKSEGSDHGNRSEPIAPLDRAFLDARDPAIDWQTAQHYGLFSMAADLIRDHVAHLQAGTPADVIVLASHRRQT